VRTRIEGDSSLRVRMELVAKARGAVRRNDFRETPRGFTAEMDSTRRRLSCVGLDVEIAFEPFDQEANVLGRERVCSNLGETEIRRLDLRVPVIEKPDRSDARRQHDNARYLLAMRTVESPTQNAQRTCGAGSAPADQISPTFELICDLGLVDDRRQLCKCARLQAHVFCLIAAMNKCEHCGRTTDSTIAEQRANRHLACSPAKTL